MKAVQNPVPAEDRIHNVKLTRKHVQALNRAADILVGLSDIMDKSSDWDPVWIVLSHVNNDLQIVNDQVRREVPDVR